MGGAPRGGGKGGTGGRPIFGRRTPNVRLCQNTWETIRVLFPTTERTDGVAATQQDTTTQQEPTTQRDLKQQVLDGIDSLPEEALAEVATFAEYQRYKLERARGVPPAKPMGLGGLWKGLRITEQDIDEARRELWGRFGERNF